MYSIVDTNTGDEIANGGLPLRPSPPGKPKGRIATFWEVGQTAEHYKCVERITVERPTPYHQRGTQTVTFDGAKVNVDPGWTLPDVATLKTKRIAQIKGVAQELINSAYPDWKQRNMTAAAVSLNEARILAGELTAEQQAIADGLNAAWGWVQSVRTHSDTLEAEINALSTAADVAAWAEHDWPKAP